MATTTQHGTLLATDSFWTDELTNASLLTKADAVFLEGERKEDAKLERLFNTGKSWLKAVGVTDAEHKASEALLQASRAKFDAAVTASGAKDADGKYAVTDKFFERIYIRDAERTFFTSSNRVELMHILTVAANQFGDYHQGVSLAGGFLLLTLDSASVLSLLLKLNSGSKYLPSGIWKSQSIASATDGYVFESLLSKHNPEVLGVLHKNHVLPETYVQKWFCALCVHVLPLQFLFPLFSQLFEQGNTVLFKFGVSLTQALKADFLQAPSAPAIYALLRLELEAGELKTNPAMPHSSMTPQQLYSSIVGKDALDKIDMSNLTKELPQLRATLYDKHLKARLQATSSSQEESAPSVSCKCSNEAEYVCLDCKRPLCEDCRDNNADDHNDDEHEVWTIEEWQEENEDKDLNDLAGALGALSV